MPSELLQLRGMDAPIFRGVHRSAALQAMVAEGLAIEAGSSAPGLHNPGDGTRIDRLDGPTI